MMNRTISTLMASGAVFGSLMVGCSSSGIDRAHVALSQPQGQASQIETLLADKDFDQALAVSEQFVSADPRNGDARALLGRAYLANGRYVSARTAFNDALTLGNRDPRTIVSLSLAEAGLGNLSGARQLLADHAADLPAGDYGLAMAMAGDPREGVRALVQAVNAPDATAKTRQNLAYALAMAGAWGQARLIAGQDLAAKDAEQRIGQWAQAAAQGNEQQRVIAMLGVSPRADDAGLPVRLALGATPEEPVQLALTGEPAEIALVAPVEAEAEPAVAAPAVEAAPQPAPVMASAATQQTPAFAPEALAAALGKTPAVPAPPRTGPGAVPAASLAFEPAPVAPAAAHKAAPDVSADVLEAAFSVPPAAPATAPVAEKPAIKAVAAPSREALQVAFHQTSKAHAASSTNWTAAIGTPVSDARASDWVVQLGAFNSAAVAKDKWQRIAAKNEALGHFQPVHSEFALEGRTFYRLAIRGFEDRGAASNACSTLKSGGQDCFVRLDDSGATKLARAEAQDKGMRQLASR